MDPKRSLKLKRDGFVDAGTITLGIMWKIDCAIMATSATNRFHFGIGDMTNICMRSSWRVAMPVRRSLRACCSRLLPASARQVGRYLPGEQADENCTEQTKASVSSPCPAVKNQLHQLDSERYETGASGRAGMPQRRKLALPAFALEKQAR